MICGVDHVDEVDNHKAANVANTQLPGNFIRRFQVGVGGGLFNVMAFGRASRVDVDGNQGFCRIDDDAPARRQFYRVLKRRFNLAFNLVPAEQWNRIAISLELGRIIRHDLRDKS